MELAQVLADGDVALAHGTVRGTATGRLYEAPATKRSFQARFFDHVRVDDGQITERVQQADMLSQMRQLNGKALGLIGLDAMFLRLWHLARYRFAPAGDIGEPKRALTAAARSPVGCRTARAQRWMSPAGRGRPATVEPGRNLGPPTCMMRRRNWPPSPGLRGLDDPQRSTPLPDAGLRFG